MNDDYIDNVKRLHDLKTSGAISAEEYDLHKSSLLSDSRKTQDVQRNTSREPNHLATGSLANHAESKPDSELSEIWQKRFDVFDRFGRPKTLATNGGLSAYSMIVSARIIFNIPAFLFGVFYLAYLGLWKRALIVLLVVVVFSIIIAFSPHPENAAFAGLFGAFISGLSANYGYYTKRRTGVESWRIGDSFR